MRSKIPVIIVLLLCAFISKSDADTIYLKNGRNMQGLITREDDKRVELDIGIGKVTFSRENIESIQRSGQDEAVAMRQEWQRQRELQEEKKRLEEERAAQQAMQAELDKFAQETDEQSGEAEAVEPVEGIDFVSTNNDANRTLEFYYYIPAQVMEDKSQTYPLLVCMPGLSGNGESFVTTVFKEFAEKEGFVILAPSFKYDQTRQGSQTGYQFPDVWSGDALINIVEKLKEQQEIFLSKYYLFGFSAGAQFVLRFAFWRPELCAACAAHASGATVIPFRKVDVKFFVSVGSEDTSSIEKTENFYNLAKTVGVDAIYRQYPGGHSLSNQQIQDSLYFFKRLRAINR
ncbi:alpha/beta hydrolase [Candidatus Omnitrophota bacterium]